MKTPSLLLVIALLGGCASLDNMSRGEKTWQALHVIDTLQTLNAANDPCYRESNGLTASLIGEQPSSGEVLAWGVGSAILHAGVSHLLEKHEAPRWVQIGWDVISIGTVMHTIARNHTEGIRPWGNNVSVGNGNDHLVNPERFPGCTL